MSRFPFLLMNTTKIEGFTMSTTNHNCNSTNQTEWTYKVDKQSYTTQTPELSGRDILTRAGKPQAEQYILIQKGHGQPREIGLNETIDLSQPGVEQFRTIQRECKEGYASRNDFELPTDDIACLNSLGLLWETVKEANVMRVVIYGYPVPPGYNHNTVDLYLRLPDTYPDSQIDMVYVNPPLNLINNKVIKALASENFDGRPWQRWSRHRVSPLNWRPDIDGIETHLALVNDWFYKEVG